MQDTQANCGPASLSNALAAVGTARSQDELAVMCKTTATEGTSAKRMLAALTALGRKPLVIREKRAETGVLFLCHWLSVGRPAILCVDNYTHWVAAVGLLGDRVLVADSADNELVLSLSRAELADRWGGTGTFYGIVI